MATFLEMRADEVSAMINAFEINKGVNEQADKEKHPTEVTPDIDNFIVELK